LGGKKALPAGLLFQIKRWTVERYIDWIIILIKTIQNSFFKNFSLTGVFLIIQNINNPTMLKKAMVGLRYLKKMLLRVDSINIFN